MSRHVYHGPEEAHLILKDDCPRCAEHAEEPWFTIDRDRLAELVDIALAWEDGGDARLPETATEREACQRILDVLNVTRAMFGASSRTTVVTWMRAGAVELRS